MKKLLKISAIILFGLSFGQSTKPVAKKILDAENQKIHFERLSPFSSNSNPENLLKYRKSAKDAEMLQINKDVINKIIKQKPEALEINIPFKGENLVISLVKNQIFTNDFEVKTSDKKHFDYTPGVYYQGIIKNDKNSLVAFSFFEDDVVGIASNQTFGNIVVGKTTDSSNFIIYSESSLTGINPFLCGVDELRENMDIKQTIQNNKSALVPTSNCVRVYYEVCFSPYQNNGSNTTTTTNWITAVHNNIATLYSNDDVRTALSELFIWTTQDPYTGTFSQNLAAFRVNRPVFNGDLAHLINQPTTTSVAYLNSLCTGSKYAYSGVSQNYGQVPVYSWTIMAMTHEMGHALGSPHTHACFWNGNGTAIDGCGPTAGYPEGCNAALPPSGGGTIMSYCHLVGSVGINFANGFGTQPGALIRSTVDSKGCLGTNCTTSCTMNINSMNINSITSTSATTTFTGTTTNQWKYRVKTMDGNVVESGNTTATTINHTGLLPNTYYMVEVGDTCSGPNAFQRRNVFLTDALWCDPTIRFRDSGGANGKYGNMESIVKTFYPALSTQKLKLTITEFDTELDYDFMNVYNGTTVAAPVFAGGANLSGTAIPPVFNATNSSGAITVQFTSDEAVVGNGWNAQFECLTLGTNETAKDAFIEIYPNPTSSILNVKSKENINSYEIVDASGRMILKEILDKKSEIKIDVNSLPKGVYVLKLITNSNKIQHKFIKN